MLERSRVRSEHTMAPVSACTVAKWSATMRSCTSLTTRLWELQHHQYHTTATTQLSDLATLAYLNKFKLSSQYPFQFVNDAIYLKVEKKSIPTES